MDVQRRHTNAHGRRPRAFLVMVLALVLCLALAACGSDDEDSASTGADAAATTEGGSGGGEDLGDATVGLIVPLTGELGDFGKTWQQAAELARDQINEVGLPGGGQIKTVVADGKTNAETGVSELRKMISTNDVSAVIGPTSELMVAMTPIAKREKVPVIAPAAGTIQLNDLGGDYIYRTVASDASDGLALARFLHSKEPGKVGMLIENQGSLPSIAATIKKSYEDQGGTIDNVVTFNPGQSSYRTEVGKLLGGNPDWIVCACGQQSGVSIIKEVVAAGYDGDWLLSSDLSTEQVVEAVGPKVMEGFYSETPSTDESNPAYKAFFEAYKQKYGEEPGLLVANSYDAMMLVGLAMVAAGSTDGEAINGALRDVANPEGKKVTTFEEGVKALQAGEDIDYEGASGPVDFDDSGTVSSSYTILVVKDGKYAQEEFYPAEDFTGASVD